MWSRTTQMLCQNRAILLYISISIRKSIPLQKQGDFRNTVFYSILKQLVYHFVNDIETIKLLQYHYPVCCITEKLHLKKESILLEKNSIHLLVFWLWFGDSSIYYLHKKYVYIYQQIVEFLRFLFYICTISPLILNSICKYVV